MSPIEMQMLVLVALPGILGIITNYQLLRTSIYIFWMKILKHKIFKKNHLVVFFAFLEETVNGRHASYNCHAPDG